MGHEASITKKIVLEKVREAVSIGNQAIVVVDAVTQRHNEFIQFTKEQFGERDQRFTTHGEWIQQVERTADAGLALATQLDDRLDALVIEVAGLRARAVTFHALSFWQRLRWLFSGIVRWSPQAVRSWTTAKERA